MSLQDLTTDVAAFPDEVARLMALPAEEAAGRIQMMDPTRGLDCLRAVDPPTAREILEAMPSGRRQSLLAMASHENRRQWARHEQFPEGSVGHLMESPVGVFHPQQTVSEAIEALRPIVAVAFITYGFVTDESGRLEGVITMRDLLFSDPTRNLGDVMLKNPFSLRADMDLVEAMKSTLHRHFPVYPVCLEDGTLVGLVRGAEMFEVQAIELSAQAGSMVGVEKEERVSTPWLRSLKFRHPWLQLNLLTAFVAAFVVGFFENTIEQIVVLAVFLPVLAGQSGNTGCQALAVTLRGMTLGEIKEGNGHRILFKEGLLGFFNGSLVGVTAGAGMYVYARMQGLSEAGMLAFVVFLAMVGACMVSGICGVMTPLVLKRLGADPATASSIFLTTFTDVASMGAFLGLATWLIL